MDRVTISHSGIVRRVHRIFDEANDEFGQLMADFAEIVPSCWRNSTVECLASDVKLACSVRQKWSKECKPNQLTCKT